MKKLVLLILCYTLSTAVFVTRAQTNGWSVHFEKTQPLGSFAKSGSLLVDNYIGEGGAAKGIGMGVKYQHSLSIPATKKFKLMFTADILYNDLTKDIKELIERNDNPLNYFQTEPPSYFNIPITAGVNVNLGLLGFIKLYGEVGLGVNFRMVSDMEKVFVLNRGQLDETAFSGKIKFDDSRAFAFRLGVGLCFFNSLSVGVNYYNLGKSELTGSLRSIDGANILIESLEREYKEFSNGKIGTSMFLLTVGWHF